MGRQHNQGQIAQMLKELGELKSLIIREAGSSYSGQLKTTEENQVEYRKTLERFHTELDDVKKQLDTANIDGKLDKAKEDASKKISEVQDAINKEIVELKGNQNTLGGQIKDGTANIHRKFVEHFKGDALAVVLGGIAVVLGGVVVALVTYCWSKLDGNLENLKDASKKSELTLITHTVGETNARREFEVKITTQFQSLESLVRDRLPTAPIQVQPVIQPKTN